MRDPHANEQFIATRHPTECRTDSCIDRNGGSTGRAGECKTALTARRHRQRENRNLSAGNHPSSARGKTAIVLVPEISLTPQTVERFKRRFADTQDTVAVLHCQLSEGERHDEWHKIQSGRARIVIGARSAVFAPLENSDSSLSMKNTRLPTSRRKRRVIMRAMLPSSGESWRVASFCSAPPRLPSKAITTRPAASIGC